MSVLAPVLASTRTDIADYLSDVVYVYTLLIFAYIVMNWIFAFGWRPSYSRAMDAVTGFLRDVCEPYLRLFRRLIPPLGGLDLSPILAIIVLQLFNSIVIQGLVHG